MKRVQHEKSATWKWQRRSEDPRKHLRWRDLQQYLMALLIIFAELSTLDVCGGPGYTSGNSAT